MWAQDVPFLEINATFKVEDDEDLFECIRAESEGYRSVLTIDNPEKYEKWLLGAGWDFKTKYDGYGRAIAFNDPIFVYLEKFSTFHFRETVADSSVTRSILAELQYYKDHGKLPSVYRHAKECIIMSHFASLDRYWD